MTSADGIGPDVLTASVNCLDALMNFCGHLLSIGFSDMFAYTVVFYIVHQK